MILIKIGIQTFHYHLPIVAFAFFQAMLSTIITQAIFKLPKWFFIISFLFPIFLILGPQYFQISRGIYGALFLLLALTFSHTLKERVPLYLTNQKTHDALKKIVDDTSAKAFLDLGSGLGGVVRAIAEKKVTSVGVETAPLLWVLSSLASILTFKGNILRQNIWNTKLHEYDVVYAFLSPAIMSKLFYKVKTEMKAGSLFVSNSFEVVGTEPDEIWQLDDVRQTVLYFYRIKK
ncbi:MAG: hypothetical protein PHY93_02270 [Bacteriovorax sp.]|nr:hypothetical protein [Bacteriovorax sp.]